MRVEEKLTDEIVKDLSKKLDEKVIDALNDKGYFVTIDNFEDFVKSNTTMVYRDAEGFQTLKVNGEKICTWGQDMDNIEVNDKKLKVKAEIIFIKH